LFVNLEFIILIIDIANVIETFSAMIYTKNIFIFNQ